MSWFRDRDMEQRIYLALKNDSRIDQSEIAVRVENNVVYLSGEVDSAAERQAAMEDVEASTFGEIIVEEVRLKNYVERTDDELKQSVKQALVRDLEADHAPVSVDARDGVITLSGRVGSFSQKSVVENIAWWTPGVTDVVSYLQVDGMKEPLDDLDY